MGLAGPTVEKVVNVRSVDAKWFEMFETARTTKDIVDLTVVVGTFASKDVPCAVKHS